jgi:hypothetical protein
VVILRRQHLTRMSHVMTDDLQETCTNRMRMSSDFIIPMHTVYHQMAPIASHERCMHVIRFTR